MEINITDDLPSLRIGFDFRFLQSAYRNSAIGGVGGVGVYTQGLWSAMVHSFPDHHYVAMIDHGVIPDRLRSLVQLAPKFEFRPFGLASRGRLMARIDRSSFSWMVRALESEFGIGGGKSFQDLDILQVLNQAPAPQGCRATVLTMYDLCQLGAGSTETAVSFRERLHRRFLQRLKRADLLVCISEATRKDVFAYLEGCEHKCNVIYPGVDLEKFNPHSVSDAVTFQISGDFFMHVGVCSGRKNPRVLLKAIQSALASGGRRFTFVFVGPYQVNPNARRYIEMTATELGIQDRIIFLGDVPDSVLASLYRRAVALVFPSLYEGFGYPPAEAIACGGACIVSNASSLPEAVGKFGALVDPNDPNEIAGAMLQMLTSHQTRQPLPEAWRWVQQFSWTAAANAYMNVYRKVLTR